MRRMPVKFAPVAPIALMNAMLDRGREVIGDYHLLLAHDVLAFPDDWRAWAEELRFQFEGIYDSKPTIIMDNSVIELGQPAAMIDIVNAAGVVDADVVVFPDVIGDARATRKLIIDFIERMESDTEFDHLNMAMFDFMFVPQGNTLPEYIESMEFAADTGIITWLGLPRDALKHGCRSRKQLIDAASLVCPGMKIHLLGFSDDLMDDFSSAHYHPNVVGIDSAVPIRAGQKSEVFRMSRNDYGVRGDYWEQTRLTEQAVHNIMNCRGLLR